MNNASNTNLMGNNAAFNMMNNVASNALKSVNVAANNAIMALNNSVGDTGTPWFWSAVVALLLVLVGLAFWKFGVFNPPSIPIYTETEKPRPASANKEETWCFVGEDMTGRWCVRVPHRGSCDPERSYSSKSDCQLTAASRMPLGVNMEGGARVAPLMGPPPSAQPIG